MARASQAVMALAYNADRCPVDQEAPFFQRWHERSGCRLVYPVDDGQPSEEAKEPEPENNSNQMKGNMNSIGKLMACTAMALMLGMNNHTHAGACGGPKEAFESVDAHSTDIYRINFRGGERASVYVSGDGDTDLDLYIYDENGQLVGSDTDLTDECLVQWTPRWTGLFRIEVRNLGNVYNRYDIRTN